MTSKAEEIIALSGKRLTRREVSEIVGCSREYVRQIKEKYGLVFHHNGPSATYCSRCRQPCKSKKRPPVCQACRDRGCWIEVACLTCGKPVRTRRNWAAYRRKSPRYKTTVSREHRACQGNHYSECLICGQPTKLTPQDTWQIKHGRVTGVTCKSKECREEWVKRHMANMQAARFRRTA